jgi:hypothetical protein
MRARAMNILLCIGCIQVRLELIRGRVGGQKLEVGSRRVEPSYDI